MTRWRIRRPTYFGHAGARARGAAHCATTHIKTEAVLRSAVVVAVAAAFFLSRSKLKRPSQPLRSLCRLHRRVAFLRCRSLCISQNPPRRRRPQPGQKLKERARQRKREGGREEARVRASERATRDLRKRGLFNAFLPVYQGSAEAEDTKKEQEVSRAGERASERSAHPMPSVTVIESIQSIYLSIYLSTCTCLFSHDSFLVILLRACA